MGIIRQVRALPLPPAGTPGVFSLADACLLEHTFMPAGITAVHTQWLTVTPIGPWQGTLKRVITVDWTGDAYAGGGWIVYPLPSNDDLCTILGQPHGHCVFAGEHLASAYGATMEGALRSGHEAARMLLTRLGG